MAVSALWIGADLNVQYFGAKRATDDVPLNSGTCTWSLADADGTEITTGTCDYVDASSGNYLGVIESTATSTLDDDTPYNLTITFDQDGYQDLRVIPMRSAYRYTT